MQFRLISALFVFIGSYLPLAIILAIQDIPWSWWSLSPCTPEAYHQSKCQFIPFESPEISIIFIIVSLSSVVFSHFTFAKISHPYQIEVLASKPIPNELINYTFPYVVSFMGVSYLEPQKLIGFGVFLLWMFAITYKSGQVLMNPLLLIFKWRLYDASIKINNNQRDVRILRRGNLTPGIHMSQTIQDFYILKD